MISLEHNFLFIHIPKTAGNAIQNVLKYYSEDKIVSIAPHHDGIERFEVRSKDYTIKKHSTLLDYQRQLGAEVINSLFTFTCVRNPWDRMISFFFSPHRGTVSWDRNEFIALVKEVKPTTDFISLSESDKSNQEGFKNVDYYIRYEVLDHDFEKVCVRVGIPPVRLPQRNASSHSHYSSYYDDELIELVRKRFYEEIKFFNYDFELVL